MEESPSSPAVLPTAGAPPARASRTTLGGPLVVICLTYAVAALACNVAPTYVSTLIDGYGLSETRSGLVATLDMLGMAVTGFVAGPFLAGVGRRRLLGAGTVLFLLGNVLSLLFDGFGGLVATRLLAGIGAGLLLVFGNTLAATTSNPTRSYGLATMTATVAGAVMFMVTPPLQGPLGHTALFLLMLLLGVVVALFVPRESTERLTVAETVVEGERLSGGLLRLLSISATVMMLVQAAYYAFAQQAAEDAGVSTGAAGTALSIGYIGGIATSALAAWLGNCWGRWKPVAVGMAVQAAASVVVLMGPTPALVLGALVVQSSAVFFGIPYLLSLNAEADTSGRFSNVGVGLFFLSLAIGPFLGGLVVDAAGYGGVAVAVIVGTLAGLIVLVPVTRALAVRDSSTTA